ncbi:sensor domain-containing diguanylate cyclase [Gallaecimonas kandeliae]|uniref:sensor domain-containing diguanylate cyclase n=1 Tax=Gallaecimonas kandeliae TaxID=3029055 RepID=UPI002648BC4C|nr:sensor domain-containing diguanylate cyclase [Gallaecimonas kandeliae]WKE64861.1 sensor domain-containing diguanylate cyclase [Gallaecimonas kandeliae]
MPSREQLMQVIQIQAEIAKLGLDLGGVMQFIVEQTVPLVQADGAVIELAEDGEMVYRAASGIAKAQLGLRLKIEDSLSGLCVQKGETLCCEDSETDPRVDRLACRQVGLRSMIVMPLKHQGTTVGVLKAMFAKPSSLKPLDITLLGLLSEVVAAAIFFSVKYDIHDLFIRATHDGMTGLANRALFMDRLRHATAQASRGGEPAMLLMIDMDGLKQINDSLGHRIGDAVILEFAKRLQQASRHSDTAARLGGDEFAVLLTSIDEKGGIVPAIRRFESAMAPPFAFEGREYRLQASMGYALLPEDGVDPEQLMDLADQRMYAVKLARKKA